ncbi:15284_t:CDS:1, partial [Gigaspora rosea]
LKPPSTITAMCPELEEIRNKVTGLTEIEIEKIEPEDFPSNRETIIKKLKEIKTIIWNALNTENNNKQSDRIKYYTERRYNDMKENTTRMINSILNRRTDRVNWENIRIPNEVLVKEKDIKEATKQHYQNWTKRNPTNMEYWEEWNKYYEERKDIPEGIYRG